MDVDYLPSNGWILNSYTATITTEKKHGGASLYIESALGRILYAEQTIQVNKSSDTTFLLSAWSKARSVPGLAEAIAGATFFLIY